MELKRVVVTGLGAITPLGKTLTETWEGLVNGKSGAGPITHFDASKFKTQFACEVKNFDPNQYFDRKEARKLDRYAQFALIAADEAIADSGMEMEKLDLNKVALFSLQVLVVLALFKKRLRITMLNVVRVLIPFLSRK